MEEALAAVARVSSELESVEEHLQKFLPLLQQPSTLASLPPLHRSAAFLSLSKTLNALFAVHLRCKGLSLEDHVVHSEVERVTLYDNKVGHFIDDLKGRKHRSVVVNVEATNRVIERAIPDLTEDQKKGLQGIKRQCVEARKPRNLLHTPLQPVRTQSITEAAAAFLEEARKELLEEQKEE
ncbi:hypothetical protein GOP47_0021676 [Adiantum capillus-veneris]|uniref:Nuclear nucleic acid-binding protein C1D n=1 Tax=Adiantum capillus-veneris TaxID=13818 RepID=A0A9D4Z6G4_ADICA|nr:hypothetical protein GOP47_0021676 [Adiantum capillus-veneris]